MDSKYKQKIQGMQVLIGNTPLLKINFKYKGEDRTIYAKAENFNMTGSIKDRMAFHIISKAYERGNLKPGDTIIEVTSGNTGIAFCATGRALGHPVTIFMPDWMSAERINLMKSLGATVRLVSREEGGFLGALDLADEMAKNTENVFLPKQFANEDNVDAHYIATGPEIWSQLQNHGIFPDAVVAGVGTGGTIMGIGKYLKEMNPKIKVYPLEPANSPTLSTGHKVGKHRIQGISDDFIPAIVHLDELDEVVSVDDGDGIIMAQKLAAELGIAVGISSGANFLGALKVQEKLGKDAVVVTVFADDNKKYLSTDLLREEPAKDDHLSKDVELIDFVSYTRVCQICNVNACCNACKERIVLIEN